MWPLRRSTLRLRWTCSEQSINSQNLSNATALSRQSIQLLLTNPNFLFSYGEVMTALLNILPLKAGIPTLAFLNVLANLCSGRGILDSWLILDSKAFVIRIQHNKYPVLVAASKRAVARYSTMILWFCSKNRVASKS